MDRSATKASPTAHAAAPWLTALAGLLLSAIPLSSEQGYTFHANQIVAETQEHWEAWDVNAGISRITPEGSVSPRFVRKRVNAALEAPRYEVKVRGGVSAGSNEHLAHHLIDGDPATWWEPDLDRPPGDWWVQLRLGRLAAVEKIVLRFVEEEAGEPFLHFDVLGWRYPPPEGSVKYLLGRDIARFWYLFETDRPNRTRRVFEIERRVATFNEDFTGEALDVLHILVTDSAADRLREVAPDTYEALPEDTRGAVEYYRKGGSRQTLTTRESYEALPSERQGRIRYYQRERPRLAEVEVWSPGDNLNYGRGQQGGRTQLWIDTQLGESGGKKYTLANVVTDADYSTGPNVSTSGDSYFFEDLGTQFWVDTVEFWTQDLSVRGLQISDGALAPDGSVEWTEAVTGERFGRYIDEQLSRVFRIEPTRIRFLRSGIRSGGGTLLEVMIYGEGYVAEVALTSEPIEMRRHQSFVSIEWEADTPAGTWVEIATRTGDRLREQLTYHDSDGLEVTPERYKKRLPRPKQGEIVSRMVPASDWSPWTRPYLESGEEVESPLRKYLQIRARVMADTVSKYGPPASLHAIRVNLTDQYAEELIGEVWPRFVEKIGEPEERSFFIRPRFTRSDQSFDQFRITATAPTTMELIEVRSGTLEDFATGGTKRWLPEELEITAAASDTLLFRLPSPIRQGVELVEVRIRPTIYGHGRFRGGGEGDGGGGHLAEGGDRQRRGACAERVQRRGRSRRQRRADGPAGRAAGGDAERGRRQRRRGLPLQRQPAALGNGGSALDLRPGWQVGVPSPGRARRPARPLRHRVAGGGDEGVAHSPRDLPGPGQAAGLLGAGAADRPDPDPARGLLMAIPFRHRWVLVLQKTLTASERFRSPGCWTTGRGQ